MLQARWRTVDGVGETQLADGISFTCDGWLTAWDEEGCMYNSRYAGLFDVLCPDAGQPSADFELPAAFAGRGFAMIHATGDGVKRLKLPGKFDETEVFGGSLPQNGVSEIAETLKRGETRVYSFGLLH